MSFLKITGFLFKTIITQRTPPRNPETAIQKKEGKKKTDGAAWAPSVRSFTDETRYATLFLDELANSLMRAESTLGVELGAPRGGLLDDLDGLDPRAVEREELLDADTIALAADGEVSGDVLASVVDGEDLALEILNAELVAFLDLDGNADDVTGVEFGEILLGELRGLLGVDLIQKLDTHDLPP